MGKLMRILGASSTSGDAAGDGSVFVCPLSHVKAGTMVRIRQLCVAQEAAQRLREIGFGEDQIVKLLTSQSGFICLVCNARMAISAQLARIILVEPLPAGGAA